MFEVKTDLRTFQVEAATFEKAAKSAQCLLITREVILSIHYTGPAPFDIVEIESC